MELTLKEAVNLAGRLVGENQPVYIICEAGVTNYGELEIAKQQADEAQRAEADIVKYQAAFVPDLISQKVSKRLAKNFGFDWYQKVFYKYMPFERLAEVLDYCRQIKMPVFATCHDERSLDFLDQKMNMPFFKIGSGEAHNFSFLEKVAKRKKPVIISFGMQTEEEMKKAVAVLQDGGVADIVALHCSTVYPTPPHFAELKKMKRLKEILGVPIGLSDHSVGWHIPLAAVALGASVIEKHLTFDKADLRSLDNPGALSAKEFAAMVGQIREIEKARHDLSETERESSLQQRRDWAGQALVAKEDILPGTILSLDLIAFKRPAKGGLPPEAIDKVLGRKTRVFIEEDEQILWEHLE